MADVFVHFDDVQYPRGRSFINRVQIKTPLGSQWLTVPIKHAGTQLIKDVLVDDSQEWRKKHLMNLQRNYASAPYFKEMYQIACQIYSKEDNHIAEINKHCIELISNYLGITTKFLLSSHLNVHAKSSEKLLKIIKQLDGDVYITGHGASDYLNHELFEKENIRVEYMDYKIKTYVQQFDGFDPIVSILDVIANVGVKCVELMQSKTIYWKNFINEKK